MKLIIKGEEKGYLSKIDVRNDVYAVLDDAPHFFDYTKKDKEYKLVRGCLYLFFLVGYDFELIADVFDVEIDELMEYSDYAQHTTDKQELMICKELLNYIYNNIEMVLV